MPLFWEGGSPPAKGDGLRGFIVGVVIMLAIFAVGVIVWYAVQGGSR